MSIVTIGNKSYQKRTNPMGKIPNDPTGISKMVIRKFIDQKRYSTKVLGFVDIPKEYDLVMNKKSELSRANRDRVIWEFNFEYEEIQYNK